MLFLASSHLRMSLLLKGIHDNLRSEKEKGTAIVLNVKPVRKAQAGFSIHFQAGMALTEIPSL